MWTFIIIIVAIVVIKFAFDSYEQSEHMKAEGGVRKKYATLIDYILSSHPKAKIFQETNTFVSVGVSGMAGSTIYYIQQTFGNVTIQMKVKNNPLFGNDTMEWTFPENMNQEHMIMKISNDIESKYKNFIGGL